MSVERQQMTRFRLGFLYHSGHNLDNVRTFEKRFGKYLCVPLDLPHVEVGADFKERYLQHAVPVFKRKSDIAGGAMGQSSFLSIDYAPPERHQDSTIWDRNFMMDPLAVFPELTPLVNALPYDDMPEFMLWSSTNPIPPHRDHGPWLDGPASIRIMLYDENENQTLRVREAPTAVSRYNPIFTIPRVTQAFSWNNLRTVHFSGHSGRMKVLMIVAGSTVNLSKLTDLLERSISKYEEHSFQSSLDLTDFVSM